MPTARKDVADYLNEKALEAAKRLYSIGCEGKGDISRLNAEVGACKAILAKCVPDLKAQELKGDLTHTLQEFVIGGPEDKS